MNVPHQQAIRQVTTLLTDVEDQTRQLARQTGLACKAGCGACCENPQIETTVAEVLPLALHLWEINQAQEKLEAIRRQHHQGVCALYEPGPSPGHGRCGMYAWRPGICRLFGFSARKNKYGKPQLTTCKVIKETQPATCQKTQEALDQDQLQAPLLSNYALSVSNADPVWGQKLLPINEAIGLAIEKIGYSLEKAKQ